jgi:hypothetical protein
MESENLIVPTAVMARIINYLEEGVLAATNLKKDQYNTSSSTAAPRFRSWAAALVMVRLLLV